MLRPPPISTLFPYTTLFRSQGRKSFRDKHDLALARDQAAEVRRGLEKSNRRVESGRSLQRGSAKAGGGGKEAEDRKSTRLNSSHSQISYAVFCLKKKIDKEE